MPRKLNLETVLHNFLNTIDFTPPCKIAVAVSGGPDSMALALALKAQEKKYGYILYALHVNHKLRPESDEEAQKVQEWMAQSDIPCIILDWHHPKIKTKIQQAARDSRYELLSNACKAKGIKAVFLAHHKEDQYETILYRLSCATGMDGLAGIPPMSIKNNIPYIRPFLKVSKNDLIQYLGNHPYIEDPSNKNAAYTRIKFRQATDYLSSLGLTIESLTEVADKAAKNRILTDEFASQALEKYAEINPLGYAVLTPTLFKETNPEIHARVLENLLMKIGGNTSFLRQKNIKEFIEKNCKNLILKGNSIGNCLVRPYQKKWLIIREPKKIVDKKPVSDSIYWDNRFLISGLKSNTEFYIAALGKNWATYKDFFAEFCPSLPSYFWQTIPAIYDKNEKVLEIVVQNKGISDILGKNFKIEFSPYCTRYKSIFDLKKRIPI